MNTTEKIVVLTGAGISAESGLPTFRDAGGLWEGHSVQSVATPEAFRSNPELVLRFYNERRAKAATVEPNAAHRALAELERKFPVVVITQNVDDLHERGGSTHVVHLHGELRKVRSTADPDLVYDLGARPIALGDRCEKGSQLRPHIVWFGEDVPLMTEAIEHVQSATRVLVVGTSLVVYPAAGLLQHARQKAEKVLINPERPERLFGFRHIEAKAAAAVPEVVAGWMGE